MLLEFFNNYKEKGKRMLKKLYYITMLILLLFFLGGCAGPRLTVINQAGAPMPNPHYVVTSTSNTHIRATYYYVGLVEVKDADYSTQLTPIYLNRNIKYIEKKAFKELNLMLQVYNPFKITYEVNTHQETKLNNNNTPEIINGVVAVSNLEYRQYIFRLPFDKGKYLYNVSLVSENNKEIYMQTGIFLYQVK